MKTSYLAFGSNLGDRRATLEQAAHRLQEDGAVVIVRASSLYETDPVGMVEQPKFLNAVVEIRTRLTPEELLRRCLKVETELGRVRRERWGPRTIDIDLLWYEGEERNTADLALPHPRMKERGFVIVPLAEVAPKLLLGGTCVESLAKDQTATGLKKMGGWVAAAGERDEA